MPYPWTLPRLKTVGFEAILLTLPRSVLKSAPNIIFGTIALTVTKLTFSRSRRSPASCPIVHC
ncbi:MULTISPECIES: hypothetical protein [unclassified Microcoleus]|uniref:hypothetical protein n=1 Tax=unclassified Microcoleus TaxID=2642155 RepID=UPI001D637800|nr:MULTISPECIES: hypothetical protein [unclassified Microcoleus]MCC3503761.1 hypothetical protein [Microcoleus sp. PH2017_19_SFW_U_A]MCC3564439.1 hypothetical protein [Microcoleus sp. PH2017_31_RDM_U_A]